MLKERSQLRPAQIEAIDFLKERGRAMDADDRGAGKTPVGAYAMHDLLPKERKLVIAPGYHMYTWRDSLNLWFPGETVIVADGSPTQRIEALAAHASWTIVSPAMMLMQNLSTEKPKADRTDYLGVMRQIQYSGIIVDESHRFRGRNSGQSNGLLAIGRQTKYLFELTGTPIYHRADDIYMQLRIIDPQSPEFKSYWRWAGEYCILEDTGFGIKVKGIRNPLKLKSLMDKYVIQRTSAEAGINLEEPVFTKITIPMSKQSKDMYTRMKREYLYDLTTQFGTIEDIPINSAGAVISNLRQFVSDPTLFVSGAVNPKMDALVDLVQDLSGSKVVVFSWYKNTAALAAERLSCPLIDGDTPEVLRHSIVENFRTFSKPEIISATIGSLSEAVDLSNASVLIFLERDWSFGTNLQAIGRVHRFGQTRAVVIYDLAIEDSYDEIVLEDSSQSEEETNKMYRLPGQIRGLVQ